MAEDGESPGDKINLKEHIGNKSVVMFGVPGAFTPGCSKVRRPCLPHQPPVPLRSHRARRVAPL